MWKSDDDWIFVGMVVTGLVIVGVASLLKLILWIIIWG